MRRLRPEPSSGPPSKTGPRAVTTTSSSSAGAPATSIRSTSAAAASQPLRPERLHSPGGTAQALGVHVLVVRHRVGDRPGHLARVGEVLDARHPGEGEADDVDGVRGILAAEPDLLVDAGRLDDPVRVTADERQTACGATAGGRPGVAAAAERPSWESSDASSPSTARARCDHSFPGRLAKSRCWARKTASGVHSAHRSAPMPTRSNSGASACSPAFTPSTYAATNERLSGDRAACARRAVSTIRVRRANRSQASACGPKAAAVVPVARRRRNSSCQARSRAVTSPWAKASSASEAARTWGTPRASR